MRKLSFLLIIVLAISILSFHSPVQNQDNSLSPSEKKAGWVLLFNGKSLDGWRTYQNLPNDSWEISEGTLHCKRDGVNKRADLITTDEYGSFELQIDWKIISGTNSGILYHVQETHHASYETGPEYQLIDDVGFPEKLEEWQKTGADYAMHPPLKKAYKPVGEYNHTRILVQGDHVQHWLNGVLVADFHAWTPEWEKLKKQGKWKDYPDYGMAHSGYIALQDHGGGIWFKNIKIRKR